MGGPYMKSTDILTKKKPPVEVFFRELMAQDRITITPQGGKEPLKYKQQ